MIGLSGVGEGIGSGEMGFVESINLRLDVANVFKAGNVIQGITHPR